MTGQASRPGSWYGLLLWCACACACAAAPPRAPVAPPVDPPQTTFEAPAHHPPATKLGQAGTPSALSVHGATSDALQLAMRMVEALLGSDRASLERCFQDPLIDVNSRRRVPRAALLDACVGQVQTAQVMGMRAAQLVDADAVAAQPVGAGDAQLPGLAPHDVRVQLVLRGDVRTRARGRRNPCLGTLYVKPGATPRIIGIAR